MKITLRKKEEGEQERVPFDKIPVGYVYISKDSTGPIMLKLIEGNAVILANCDRTDWFCVAKGFKGVSAYKILGKLTEIIVEEE